MIRNLRSEDIDFALALTGAEGWSYTRGELERMLVLDPDGSFLYEEGKPLAFITCVTYGRTGVVGHLIVSREVRGRKIGKLLITKAVEYMSGRGIDSMLLYATDEGAQLYSKHGFRISREVACIHVANRPGPAAHGLKTCSRVQRGDLDQIASIDAGLFGDDRRRLITLLYDEFPGFAFKLEDEDRIRGYCFGRKTDTGYDIGPWVCLTGSHVDADSLFRAVLSQMEEGKTVYTGVFEENKRALGLVNALPRVRAWRTQLMIRGADRYSASIDKNYGVAAFELG